VLPLTVQLPQDLAEFVAATVRDGTYRSADELVARALTLLRIQTPPPVGVIELTRAGFDGPSFMASLADKLEQTRPPKKPK
jgi:hypothetical protein